MSDDQAFREIQAMAALSGEDGPLPPHFPSCFGCGEQAEHGLHLHVRREGDEILADYVFAPWQAGAPGIAHGGMVSAVCDDFLGFGLYLSPRVAVTRALQVEFRRPVALGVTYALRGWVEEAHDHKAWYACEAVGADGEVAFSARGLFVGVRKGHFTQGRVTP